MIRSAVALLCVIRLVAADPPKPSVPKTTLELEQAIRKVLAENKTPGAGVANLFLASGAMPLARYLAAGVRIGLGSDVAAGPDAALFSVMRAGAYTQNALRAAEPSAAPPLSPADWLRLGTMGGAEALGIGAQIGSVEAGKEADLIAVDPSVTLPLEGVGSQNEDGPEEMLSRLIFRAHPAMVRGAWVRGRLLPA